MLFSVNNKAGMKLAPHTAVIIVFVFDITDVNRKEEMIGNTKRMIPNVSLLIFLVEHPS